VFVRLIPLALSVLSSFLLLKYLFKCEDYNCYQ
jgi:hypothetical protein